MVPCTDLDPLSFHPQSVDSFTMAELFMCFYLGLSLSIKCIYCHSAIAVLILFILCSSIFSFQFVYLPLMFPRCTMPRRSVPTMQALGLEERRRKASVVTGTMRTMTTEWDQGSAGWTDMRLTRSLGRDRLGRWGWCGESITLCVCICGHVCVFVGACVCLWACVCDLCVRICICMRSYLGFVEWISC